MFEYVETKQHIKVQILLHINDFNRFIKIEQRPFCLIVGVGGIIRIDPSYPEPKASQISAMGLLAVYTRNLLVPNTHKFLI